MIVKSWVMNEGIRYGRETGFTKRPSTTEDNLRGNEDSLPTTDDCIYKQRGRPSSEWELLLRGGADSLQTADDCIYQVAHESELGSITSFPPAVATACSSKLGRLETLVLQEWFPWTEGAADVDAEPISCREFNTDNSCWKIWIET